MKETVLLYNINGEKAKNIKRVLLLLGLRGKNVSEDMYGEKLGILAGMLTEEAVQNEKRVVESENSGDTQDNVPFTEEMLVMCGFSNEKVDKFLIEMKKKKVEKINLKAVLTPYNAFWNSYELYHELKKEHESFGSLSKSPN
ncbi:MAG: DUF3783 domain-containing protein [Lachnospiraceae bacterium]|nr:DUF3783 domain-containing protein [Lachnospiraceae bacterium]